jgi:hypothetical protein
LLLFPDKPVAVEKYYAYYVYQCEKCEDVVEVKASIQDTEHPLHLECLECCGKKICQVLAAGVVIHGIDGASFPIRPIYLQLEKDRAKDKHMVLEIKNYSIQEDGAH